MNRAERRRADEARLAQIREALWRRREADPAAGGPEDDDDFLLRLLDEARGLVDTLASEVGW